MQPVRQVIGGLGNLMFKQAYLYAQMREGVIPDIYVQSAKYWSKYADEVRRMFIEGITKRTDDVSLHIRRGDYVGNSFYVDLTETDYYKKAVLQFPSNTKFLVFYKDRQKYVEDYNDSLFVSDFLDKLGINYRLYDGISEIEDMNAMASCKGHIMANSSFSWWASFLGGGMTVAPKQWFTDGVQRIDLLDDWIKL